MLSELVGKRNGEHCSFEPQPSRYFLSTVNSILYYCCIILNISPSDTLIKAKSSGSGLCFDLFKLTNYMSNINKLYIILKLNVMLLEI